MPDRSFQFRIKLLGTPSLAWNGQPFTLQRKQARALIYVLGATLEPVPRDMLVFLFWPDPPEQDQVRQAEAECAEGQPQQIDRQHSEPSPSTGEKNGGPGKEDGRDNSHDLAVVRVHQQTSSTRHWEGSHRPMTSMPG